MHKQNTFLGGCQSLCLLNCLRSKNTLKQGKFLNFWNWQLNLKRSWKVMAFEELKRLQTLSVHPAWMTSYKSPSGVTGIKPQVTRGKLVNSPSQSAKVQLYPEPFFQATVTKIIISITMSDQLWLPSNPAYNSTAQFYTVVLYTKCIIIDKARSQDGWYWPSIVKFFFMDQNKVVANRKRTKWWAQYSEILTKKKAVSVRDLLRGQNKTFYCRTKGGGGTSKDRILCILPALQ